MACVSKQDRTWLEEHGKKYRNGWVCKKTEKPINQIVIGRSIHFLGMSGGFGEVRNVIHLYCTGCNPDFIPPQYGAPIQEDELVYV